MTRRIVSMLLVLCMVLGMMPLSVLAEEDTTPAQITGVAITVDGVTYTEGEVIIKPDSTITVTFLGTNLAQMNPASIIDTPQIYMRLAQATAHENGVISSQAYPYYFEGADCYPITYTNDNWATTHNSGIFVTYDDTIVGAPTEITGLAITVDGVTYTEGNVIVKPDSTVSFAVFGNNLQNGSEQSVIDTPNSYLPLYRLPPNENGEYIYSTIAVAFVGGVNYPITYTNDGWVTTHDSGIFVTYDDGTSAEPAEITGMSITVDGVTYDGSSATLENPAVINADSTVTFTINGTNLDKLPSETNIFYSTGSVVEISSIADTITPTQIIATMSAERFRLNGIPFELCYAHSYYDDYSQTGIHVVYDFRGEEAVISGMKLTVDGIEYTSGTVLIRPESQVTLTVLGENLQNISSKNNNSTTIDFLNGGWVLSADGTESSYTSDSSPYSNFDPVRELRYCNDSAVGDEIGSGIFVYYGTQMPAQITGVSITVDGVTYTEGEVVITPSSEVSFTVSGTDFANLDDVVNQLEYATEIYDAVAPDHGWDVDADNGVATKDFTHLMGYFSGCSNYQVRYTNTGASFVWTDLYLTYDDSELNPEETAKIVIDMTDEYGGWNGAAIEIYENDTLTATATLETETSATVELDANSDASYKFKWVKAGFDDECSFVITIDGEVVLEVAEVDYADGQTILIYENGAATVPDPSVDIPDSTGKIVIQMTDILGEGWHGAAIEIYQNDTLLGTATVGNGYSETAELAYDSDASYEFKWVQGSYDDFCSFVIYVDGEEVLQGDGIDYSAGQTILTYENGVATDPNRPEDVTLAIGDNALVGDTTYTYTAEQDGTLYITVTELYYGNTSVVPENKLGNWVDILINDTAISAFENSVEVSEGDTVTVSIESLDGDTYSGTVNLSWTAPEVFIPDSTGKIVIEMTDEYGDSWNGAAIEIYKNGALELTSAITSSGVYTEYESLEYDSTATYEFKWVSGDYDSECTFVIYADGEIIVEGYGDGYLDGETILTLEETTPPDDTTPELAITRQPTNAQAVLNEMFYVTVEAEGSELSYQWYYKDPQNAGFIASSIRTDTYSWEMTKGRANRQVYCVITDALGNTVTTDTVTIQRIPAVELAILTQPQDTEAAPGETFAVTVEAQGEGLKYQWYYKNRNSDEFVRSSRRSDTYSWEMIKERADRQVYCVITDALGNTVTTDTVTIRGIPTVELAILSQPRDTEAAPGETFTVSVEAQGDGLKYQWYFKNRNSDKFVRSSHKSDTYSWEMTKDRTDRQVYCVITDALGNTVTTDTVTIRGIPTVELAILSQPRDTEAAPGETFTVSVEAQGDGLKYQWYFKNRNSDEFVRSSHKGDTYSWTMEAFRSGRQVYCVITDALGNTVTTDTVTVTQSTQK